MQKKMHFIYSKVHCTEKDINGKEEERHRESLHLSLSFQLSSKQWSMFWEFTGSLKKGMSICKEQRRLCWLWFHNSFQCAGSEATRRRELPWFSSRGGLGPCIVPTFRHHSCLLQQQYQKQLPVWVRPLLGSRLFYCRSQSSPIFVTGHLAFIHCIDHSLFKIA